MDETREAEEREEKKVRVTDRRRTAKAASAEVAEEPAVVVEGEIVEDASSEEAVRDYLDDLRRLQADFDNYRKRMMREQAAIADRAIGAFVTRLLPVLDNFELAAAHADEGSRVIFKDLRSIFEAEGVEEIPAAGEPFDPTVHEAVQSRPDPSVDEPTVAEVSRSGYTFKGAVLRPAMVVVALPEETDAAAEATEE